MILTISTQLALTWSLASPAVAFDVISTFPDSNRITVILL